MAGEKHWSLGQVWDGWMDLLGVAPACDCSGGNSPSFCTETLSTEASSVGGFNDVKTSLLRSVVLFADHEELIRR